MPVLLKSHQSYQATSLYLALTPIIITLHKATNVLPCNAWQQMILDHRASPSSPAHPQKDNDMKKAEPSIPSPHNMLHPHEDEIYPTHPPLYGLIFYTLPQLLNQALTWHIQCVVVRA